MMTQPINPRKYRSPAWARAWAWSLLLMLAGALPASAAPAAKEELRLLTSAQELRSLPTNQAKRGYPVRLRGVVTYYDAQRLILFVQDETAGIYVHSKDPEVQIKSGQRVEVTGFSAPGEFAPVIIQPRFQVLGDGSMPAARPSTFERLLTGIEDSQWVSVRGIVRSVTNESGHALLDVAARSGRFRVTLPGFRDKPVPAAWIDAEVALEGVCGTIFNQRRQSVGVQMFVPAPEKITVIQPAPANPFSMPAQEIRSLLQFKPQEVSSHRVRVQGTVTLVRWSRYVFIQDGSGGLYLEPEDMPPLAPGDRVDVIGFPAAGEYTPVLQNAIVRRTGLGPLPEPAMVTALQAVGSSFTNRLYDAELVRIRARFLEQTPSADDQVLVLQDGQWIFDCRGASKPGQWIFDAHLEKAQGHLPALAKGSVLQVTGVCSVQVDEHRNPRAFRVLLRSPADVAVLQRPPWWTVQRTLAALGFALLISVAAFGWVTVLRRQVRGQTARIRRQLEQEAALQERYRDLFENANDVVYTHDLEGNFTSVNPSAERITGYSRQEICKMNTAQVMAPEQLKIARSMSARNVAGEPVANYELEILAKDGRRLVLEISSRPIFQDGKPVAIQGIARDITERKRAVEALRQAEENYRSIFENAFEGIAQVTPEGRFLSANAALARTLGYASPEELMTSITDMGRQLYVKPGRRAELVRLLQEQGCLSRGEAQVYRKDKSIIWVSVSSTVVRDASGRVLHFESVIADTTERKRAELRKAAFSTLGQKLSAATTRHEAAQIIAEVADSLLGWDSCSIDLYSPEKDEMYPLLDVDTVDGRRRNVPPAYEAARPSTLARRILDQGPELILREPPFDFDPAGVPFGDTARPSASLLLVPIHNGPQIIGLLSIQSYKAKAYGPEDLETLQSLADLCGGALERIRAAEALRESENRFHQLVEHAADAIYVHDLKGRIVDVNEQACANLGYSRSELLALSVPDVVENVALETMVKTWEGLRPGSPVTIESYQRRKDGTRFPVEVRLGKFESGSRQLFLALVRDVTERIRLEEQLRHVQKMESVGQLAAGVAHDFNNILTIIKGYASLLQMSGEAGPALAEPVQQISDAAQRAADLTRQLLIFGRRQAMQPAILDLNDVIGKLADTLRRLLGEDVGVQFNCAVNVPPIFADASMVEQAIMNLATNAREAMPQGGQLTISTLDREIEAQDVLRNSEARTGRYACLIVQDTGCGMDAATVSKLFEPFFTTKDVGKGAGLGLAAIYGIVKQHYGWIEVASQAGRGSTFKIFLPAHDKSPLLNPPERPVHAPASRGQETILLVEDEAALRGLVRLVLQKHGYTVREAQSGVDALSVWRQEAARIDLLLTDMTMPEGMSGRELAEQLQAEKAELKVIYTSGYSLEMLERDCVLKEGINFLQKPYPPHVLLQAVRECLDQPDPRKSGPAEAGRHVS